MNTNSLPGLYYGDILKRCKVCEKLYGPKVYGPGRMQGLREFLKTKYCSSECTGLAQRNTFARLHQQVQIDPETGCHNWTGTKNQKGYGHVMWNMRTRMVHRLMWEELHGEIPEYMELDHVCRNRACCNPDHLRVVSTRENTLASNNPSAIRARSTACMKCGGPYSVWPNGYRYCKPCRTAGMKAWYARHKEEIAAERKAKRLKNTGD